MKRVRHHSYKHVNQHNDGHAMISHQHVLPDQFSDRLDVPFADGTELSQTKQGPEECEPTVPQSVTEQQNKHSVRAEFTIKYPVYTQKNVIWIAIYNAILIIKILSCVIKRSIWIAIWIILIQILGGLRCNNDCAINNSMMRFVVFDNECPGNIFSIAIQIILAPCKRGKYDSKTDPKG